MHFQENTKKTQRDALTFLVKHKLKRQHKKLVTFNKQTDKLH
jgi:hypothetical protein